MKTLFLLLALAAGVCAQNNLDPTWVSATAAGTITTAGTGSDCSIAASCAWIVGPTWAVAAKVVVSGTYTGTLQFESATDGKTWGSVAAVSGVTSTSGTGTYYFQIPQVPCLRIRASALSAGKAQIAITALDYVPVIPSSTSSGTACPNGAPAGSVCASSLYINGVLFTGSGTGSSGGTGNGSGNGSTYTAITFTTSGTSFAPLITVTGSPTILWSFDDGTTSSSATPSHTYTSGTHNTTLTVTPWTALTGINVGYQGDDGGPGTIATVTPQNVTAITGLTLATNLTYLAASWTPIAALDLHGLTALTDVECFECTSLASYNISGTSALTRTETEYAQVATIDVSSSPNLADFRGGHNSHLNNINWGAPATHPNLWHICVLNDTSLNALPTLSNYPQLTQMWLENSNQSGTLTLDSTNPVNGANGGQFLIGYSNNWTSVNASNSYPTAGGQLDVHANALTTLTISNDPGLTQLNASQNNLPSTVIDATLATLVANGQSNGYVNLQQNTPPSSAGVSSASTLTSRGWTVLVDTGTPTVSTPTFSPAGGSYSTAQSVTLSDSTSGATIYYTTNGSTPTCSSTTYSSAITTVSSGSETIKAIACASGYNSSAVASATYSISASLAITTASLPGGTQNSAYSATLAASGGTSPYTWSVSSGSLPTGLSLASSTGVISGTPTVVGTTNFTIQVADSASHTATAALSITIGSGVPIVLVSHAENQSFTGAGENTLSTNSVTNTSGNVLACLVMTYATGIGPVTDTLGDTWSHAAVYQDSGPINGQWWYTVLSATGANVVTETFGTTSNGYDSIRCMEFSGIVTVSPLDIVAAGAGNTSPSFTTGQTSEVILAGQHETGASSFTPSSGCTMDIGLSSGSSVNRPVEYCIVTNLVTSGTVGITPSGGSTATQTNAISLKGQ